MGFFYMQTEKQDEECTRFFLGLTNTLEGLPVEKRRTMARACLEIVGLYGTETMVSTDKHMRVIEELEVTQRRYARKLTSS